MSSVRDNLIAARAAQPAYAVGQIVNYVDRQGRLQTGRVLRIEANWTAWGDDYPLIIYTFQHPTYRNKRMYGTAATISTQEPPNAQ